MRANQAVIEARVTIIAAGSGGVLIWFCSFDFVVLSTSSSQILLSFIHVFYSCPRGVLPTKKRICTRICSYSAH